MADEIEAAGAFVTAGLAASALDTPGAAGHDAGGGTCANCGAALSGPFCGQCGQRAHLHRTIGAVFHEFLHGITHFDGKAWKTLPMLLFRPGRLIRSYIDGQRMRYIAPVPLFLLVIFLMFLVFSFLRVGDDIKAGGVVGGAIKDGRQMTRAEAAAELPKIDAELNDLDKQIAAASRGEGEPYALPGLKGARIGAQAARDQVAKRATGSVESALDIPAMLAAELADPQNGGKLKFDLGDEALNAKAAGALKNPELVLYKLQTKAYKLSFLLVPLSLPWVWLMFFWRRDLGLYDHAIFTLYSISFMSLWFIASSLLYTTNAGSALIWVPLLLAPAVHMYASLRGAYAIGRFGALWRTFMLSNAAVITLSAYLMLLIILGVVD